MSYYRLTSEEFDELIGSVDKLREFIFKYGDMCEYPKPASAANQIVYHLQALYGMDVNTEPGVLQELGRFAADQLRGLKPNRKKWAHADQCIEVCDHILKLAPDDGD